MKKILYHLHIMWYEVEVVKDTLDSLCTALQNTHSCEVDIRLAFNYQTYIEKPDGIEDVKTLFSGIKQHRIFQFPNKLEVVEIQADANFYNVADWRRDNYGDDYDYYVWGESDCLVPNCYFNNICRVKCDGPHVVSYSNRKMWESSWLPVEHALIQPVPYDENLQTNVRRIGALWGAVHMTEEQMNEFNSLFPVEIIKFPDGVKKIDGNMMAIGRGLPTPILPYDLHFVNDDLALEVLLKIRNIPQFHFPFQLKAHNRMHPLKRKYTQTIKEDATYMHYRDLGLQAIQKLANQR